MEYLKQPRRQAETITPEIRETVSRIIADVEREGKAAVLRYSEQFDNWAPNSFRVSQQAVDEAYEAMEERVERSAQFLIDQVTNFARLQRETLVDFEAETLPGVILGQRHISVGSVGAYSPGGYYPLIASAVMTVATAKAAGVRRVLAVGPPRGERGIHPPQLWAM